MNWLTHQTGKIWENTSTPIPQMPNMERSLTFINLSGGARYEKYTAYCLGNGDNGYRLRYTWCPVNWSQNLNYEIVIYD